MSSFEEGVYQYLTSQTTFTDLLNDRLFPDIVPLNVSKPYIVYRIVSEGESSSIVAGNFGVKEKNIEFLVIGDTRSQVNSIHEVLETLLKNYNNVSFYGYHLQLCTFEYTYTEFDDYNYGQYSEFKFIYTQNS